jgi:hypothetical protein
LALSDIKERLAEMAKLSVLANRINEIQEKNLKTYPFVFFNDILSARIEFDLSKVNDDGLMNHSDHHVTYFLRLDEETNREHLDKRFFALTNAVRTLFWTDLNVRVNINGKMVYRSDEENVEKSTS